MEQQRTQLWQAITSRLPEEYAELSDEQRSWIEERLTRIEELQQQLDELFSAADGAAICRHCQGQCCRNGYNHLTLANLLNYYRYHHTSPPVDFSATCPYLGECGCVLPVASRPYNCITFICDSIEAALNEQQRERFYALDSELRSLYLEFARRYPSAAMTGVLIQEQRRPGQNLFEKQESCR